MQASNERQNTCIIESPQVVRKFINSAIYVEKPLSTTVSSESTSISQKYSSDDLLESPNLKTKRCTCSTDQKTCPCHKNLLLSLSPTRITHHQEEKTKTVIKSGYKTHKVSQRHNNNIDNKEAIMKNWLIKKEEEKKKRELHDKIIKEKQNKEREILLEQERKNFTIWLMNKKKRELEAKKKKEKQIEDQKARELEKEKRQLENQLNFQLWLKKKEEAHLEKRIQEQIDLINELERKEKQLKENEKAFNDWLEKTRSRPKLIPANKKSLCSSTSPSVTFMNPNPWNPIV